MSDTYTYPCECTNCDHSFEAQIARGTPKDGPHECPRCGCKTGQPKRKAVPLSPTAPQRPIPPGPTRPYYTRPEPTDIPWYVPEPFHRITCDRRTH